MQTVGESGTRGYSKSCHAISCVLIFLSGSCWPGDPFLRAGLLQSFCYGDNECLLSPHLKCSEVFFRERCLNFGWVFFVLFCSDFCHVGLAPSYVPACSQSLAVLFCDSRQSSEKLSHFLFLSIVWTQPAPVTQRKILKCQQLVILISQSDYPPLFVCTSCLSGFCVSAERITSWSCFFLLISSGIARVGATELYKLVSNRKDQKFAYLLLTFLLL